MSKRESTESKIVGYFTNSPLGVAEAIFGIVKGIMKSRNESHTAGDVVTRPRKAKKRSKANAGTATSFPGQAVESRTEA